MSKPKRTGSLTPEERYQRSVSAKRKFRAIIRLIIANLTWLQEIEDDKLGDNVKKNIAVLTRKKGKKSLLTLRDKAVLNKPQELRTETEKNHLKRIIGNLKCFRRYPPEVKNELPSIMYFCYFGPNRIIVKQGYEPLNMYVILSGEVIVSISYYDKLLHEQVKKDVTIMGAGSYFGEVSLLHGIERTATVTTTQDSEFLYIKREDFDRVLKETVTAQWAELLQDMSLFSYFKDWSSFDLRECCIYGKKKNFEAEQIVLSGSGGESECVYFVIKGSCYLIEHMTIGTKQKNGITHYYLINDRDSTRPAPAVVKNIKKLYKKQEVDTEHPHTSLRPIVKLSKPTAESSARSYFFKVCTFSKLACFNVGESLNNRIIVALEDCECLLLPRYFLMEKSMITFKTIEQFLSHHIPSRNKIFQRFLAEKRWTKHKQQLVNSILGTKKPSTYNTIHNVPYSIRLSEDLGEI